MHSHGSIQSTTLWQNANRLTMEANGANPMEDWCQISCKRWWTQNTTERNYGRTRETDLNLDEIWRSELKRSIGKGCRLTAYQVDMCVCVCMCVACFDLYVPKSHPNWIWFPLCRVSRFYIASSSRFYFTSFGDLSKRPAPSCLYTVDLHYFPHLAGSTCSPCLPLQLSVLLSDQSFWFPVILPGLPPGPCIYALLSLSRPVALLQAPFYFSACFHSTSALSLKI